MATSLYEDILKKVRALNEQAPPPLPPEGGGSTPATPSAGAGSDSPGRDEKDMVDAGQPPVDPQNPVDAVYDYGMAIAKQTVDVETILKAFKSAIQSNFGYNIEASWPIVERLRNTENQTLINVANRLSLFISGTIQENKKRDHMKVTKEEIRSYVKEAVASHKNSKTVKEVQLTSKQFNTIIEKTVARLVKEGALFDTYRTQIDQEQSAIEQQLTSADIRRMAIDLFEKICDKTGVDADSLTPEAMEFVKAELDRMVTSAQEIANKLVQVAAVVKTASAGVKKNSEGEE